MTRRCILLLTCGLAATALSGCAVDAGEPAIDDVTQALNAPVSAVNIRYDVDDAGLVASISMPVGIWEATNTGRADIFIDVALSYTAGGEPVELSLVAPLRTAPQRSVDRVSSTAIVDVFLAGPEPDDMLGIAPCIDLVGPNARGGDLDQPRDSDGLPGSAPTPHP